MIGATGKGVLIVGGGSRLAWRLRRRLPAARVVVRRAVGGPDEVIVADYRDVPATAFAGIDAVVNCVGTSSGDAVSLYRVNVDVPVAVATAARAGGCRHFVQLSSLSVYGRASAIDAATFVAPVTAYGRSKAAADAMLLAMAKPPFAVTVLRIPALYGVGVPSKLMRLAWTMAQFGFVAPRRTVLRSFLHIENASAVIDSLLAEPRGGVVLAADHDPFELTTFAAAVAREWGRPVRLIPLADWLDAAIRRTAPRLHASVFASSLIYPAAAITSSMALPVSLADGIAAMLASDRRSG